MSNDQENESMRRQIESLLEESKRIRDRSEDLAKRIAELRDRIEKSDAEERDDTQ